MKAIPIFLSSDNNYAPFVATTIASACDNTESFCNFYVLDSGISDENKEKICKLKSLFSNFSIEFIKIDLGKDLKSIEYKNDCIHVTLSTYNRFLIPKLKPNLGKVLYLDIDIIVLDNISKLYDLQLDKYSVAAVSEINTNNKNAKERCKSLNLDNMHNYFNAGVLIIDIQKWIKEDVSQKLFDIEKKYRDKLHWADQDVLNILFNNNYLRIPEKFNFMTGEQKIDSEIIIRHYNTEIKPWHFLPNLKTSLVKNCEAFWKYMKMTNFYSEMESKCIYKTQEDLKKLRLQKLIGRING